MEVSTQYVVHPLSTSLHFTPIQNVKHQMIIPFGSCKNQHLELKKAHKKCCEKPLSGNIGQ